MPDSEPLWTSAEIVAATGGSLSGAPFAATGITYNSREIVAGDLFVALKGARDGHDFADMAFANGAAGAIVERAVSGPAVITADTLQALEGLGVFSRERAPQVKRGAVTGSVGKTSVTQAIKAGLDLAGPAHASIKSYNNHIGVPLTLARMPRATRRAVFEIGMNAPGEIAPLSKFVQPHAACVTTVGPVHIEAFADGEAGVAAEKASIFEGLVPGGTAVANGDVAFSGLLCDRAKALGARLVTFGSDAGHDARLLDFQPFEGGARVRAELYGKALDYQLAQSGFHWGLNSLCVLLMLDALDVTLETGLEALAHFRPLAGRGETTVVRAPGGAFTLIDESYNANPLSMAAGFRSLGAKPLSAGGRRIVVLTDMLELGDQSHALHEGLAQPIDAAGLDLVHAAGPEMKRLYDSLPAARRGEWRETAAELAADAATLAGAGDIVMVKGSNGSKASLVAKALAALGNKSVFYLLYLYFQDVAQDYPLLNLVQYQTVRVALAMATAMIVAVAMGSRFINWMRAKQGKGQPIRSDGPITHLSKVGTPTMGGLMILAGIAVAVLLWGDLTNPYIWIVSFVTAAFGVLGFIDDYAKVTKQTSAGLTSKQKLVAQTIISVIAGVLTVLWMTASPTSPGLETSIAFPFFKAVLLNIGWFYVIFAAFTIVGFSNAVNLTDGLDGLAIVPVMMASAAFGLIAYLVGNFIFSQYLGVHHVPGSGELAIFCAAIIGGGVGFLWYNAPPAKIFMGDTGSLALGGALGSIAVATKHELVLGIVGGLFVIEAASVMIQVAYFKATGKRIFLMAPIHHHFEKMGWPESTVVIRFWIVAAMLALAGLATLKLR